MSKKYRDRQTKKITHTYEGKGQTDGEDNAYVRTYTRAQAEVAYIEGSVSHFRFPCPCPFLVPFPVPFPSYEVLPRTYDQAYESRTTSNYRYIMSNRSEQLQMNL